MRAFIVPAMLLVSGSALAQAPTVNESTGDLSYAYAFKVPKARGRFQPELGLTYSSASREDRGYGLGWTLTATYIERDTRVRPGKVLRWLVRGGDRKLLVAVGSTYRSEVEESHFQVTETTVSGVTTYTAYDAHHTRFTFGRVMGGRSYLTRVEDLDGNIAELAYDGDKEDVVEVRYNNYPVGAPAPSFASVVRLEYVPASGLAWGNVAGALLDRKHRLSRVRVMGPAGAGVLKTVRGYELTFTPAGRAGATSIARITEYGGDFAASLPPTEFGYDFNGYALAPTAATAPAPVGQVDIGNLRYEDVDGDGRADLVWWDWGRLHWAKSITPIGSDAPAFSNVMTVTLPAQTRAGVVNDVAYLDFDGDGVLDAVRAIAGSNTMPSPPYYHEINRGVIDVSGNLTFSPTAVVLDVSAYGRLLRGTARALVVQAPGSPVDLNGDGVLDYAKVVPAGECGTSTTAPCAWNYGLTILDWSNPAASQIVAQSNTVGWVPGGAWSVTGSPSKTDRFGGVDLNGDGLADSFSAGGTVWDVALNLGASADSGQVAMWRPPPWSTTLGGYADYPQIAATPTDPVQCHPKTFDDTRYQFGDVLDLNGDGRPEFMGSFMAYWNDGRTFGPGEGVPYAPDYVRYDVGWTYEWRENCSDAGQYYSCECSAEAVGDGRGQYADMNGDGIPDFIQTLGVTVPAPLELRAGRTANGLSHPAVLRTITTPDGATFTVDYVPSATFGVPVRSGRRPVVVSLSVTGTQVQPNTTFYWYAEPTGAPAWYEPNRWDDRGFRESWSQDLTTRQVRHVVYATQSHALASSPATVESGYPSSRALGTKATISNPGAPPSMDLLFSRETHSYGQKSLLAGAGTGCITRSEPGSSDYPLRVIATLAKEEAVFDHGAAATMTSVDCRDVDADGNVLLATTAPQIAISGPPVLVRQVLTGTTQCPGVPAQLTVSKEDAFGKVLAQDVKTFDALCRVTAQWAVGTATPRTNLTSFAYGGPFGQLDTSSTGGVTKRITYDATFGLHVTEERTEDALTALVTSYGYDTATGLRLSVVGPYLTKQNGVPASSSTYLSRYYRYDLFGRTVTVAKQPFTGTTSPSSFIPPASGVNQAVEAYEYRDDLSPRAVISYRFSVAMSYTSTLPTGQIPQSDDVAKSVAYRDALGRTIQVRERLGGSGSADPAARIVQTATGFKVTTAVVLDGAGRPRLALEPFYDAGEAFVDYAVTGVPAARGTVTTYDDERAAFAPRPRGQPWCTSYQYVSGTVPGPAVDCRSSSAHTAAFRLATESWADVTIVAGRGGYSGYFVGQYVVPPEVNAIGGTTPRVSLRGPGGEELGAIDGDGHYTWIERDLLAREAFSWRESATRALATPKPVSYVRYNLAGQVIETWDANLPKVTRKRSYDEAGRLVYVTTDPSTGEGIQYVFSAGDLGRISEVREVTYSASGASTVKLVARNHYDAPYLASEPGYAFVAGKLAWTENDETVIAYGYDDAGRVWRRDQWFARLDPSKRFTVSSTYGPDGRVLDSRVVSPYSASAEYQYTVDYDSAGRPVGISGGFPAAAAPQNVFQRIYETVPQGPYGSYDALGRVAAMKADNGYVVSARKYNAYSGQLEGECKRFDTTTACTGTALDPARDIFRTDVVPITYEGGKLKRFTDSGTSTQYTATYLPSGRLQIFAAQPTGTVGALTQDWLEAFAFNGIGNIDNVQAQRNTLASPGTNPQPPRYESERYVPESPVSGQALDRVSAVTLNASSTPGGPPMAGAGASTTTYAYDLLQHLTAVSRSAGESESLTYAPGGELLYRQVGEKFMFYVGEYATVTARGATGCASTSSCTPQPVTVEVDAHVIFAGTPVASAKPARTLYYYRTYLGTVIATSLSGGRPGAAYRYTPYGAVERAAGETDETRSDLGYTNALRLSGSLLYLKARVYDTQARVFIQADEVDRLRYAYVQGDPVNASDPTGLMMAEWSPTDLLVIATAATSQAVGPPLVLLADPGAPSHGAMPSIAGESVAQEGNGIALQTAGVQWRTERPEVQSTRMCHGTDASGFHGDATAFHGLPGSGPNAAQGYRVIRDLTVEAVVTVGLSVLPGAIAAKAAASAERVAEGAGARTVDVLRPGGRLIGEAGTSSQIRILQGGKAEAEALFGQLSKGGEVITDSKYPGTLVRLPDGGSVGFRPVSTSGPPTIDVTVKGLGIREIKFLP